MNYSVDKARSDLDKIPSDISLYDRMLEVSAIITMLMSEYVKESDMPIIVGGFSLEIYTESEYTTHDIDFVTSASGIMKEKLMELGFKDNQRVFQFERLNIAVDIVDDTLEPPNYGGVTQLELENGKYVFVQSRESILYDRLLDYNRSDNIKYGIYLISTMYDEIDFDYLRYELNKADPKALESLEQWIEKALVQ